MFFSKFSKKNFSPASAPQENQNFWKKTTGSYLMVNFRPQGPQNSGGGGVFVNVWVKKKKCLFKKRFRLRSLAHIVTPECVKTYLLSYGRLNGNYRNPRNV